VPYVHAGYCGAYARTSDSASEERLSPGVTATLPFACVKIGAGQSSCNDGQDDFLHRAQEALWMADEGPSKGQNQRKMR
jgi:hypothetical protein